MLTSQKIFQTPDVVDCFEGDGQQFLLLQWITAGGRTEMFWQKFGEALAALHQVTDNLHGFSVNNYMGSVPQQNNRHLSWTEFFAAERIMPMVKRCTDKGQLSKKHLTSFDSLPDKLPSIFEEELPSLLHGDLWSGNFMCNEASEPVLIDPAVYFGHRSVDLGMSTLFGGFSGEFYEAYHYHFPMPTNYREQWAVCNLYPLLIHLYLFGSSYLPRIESTLKKFT